MRKNVLFTLLATLILLAWMPSAGAQGDASIAAKQAEIAKLKQKIVAIDQRRREDASQVKEANKRLQEAQAELQSAKVDFSADGSELNARRVKNAEFAMMLKKREADRLQERLQNYNTATKQTALKAEALERQIADLKAGKAPVAPAAPSNEELAKTQQELEAARARNEAAKQELTRLRAMMAEANKGGAAKAAPATAAPAATASVAPPVAAPETKAVPVAATQPEPAKVTLTKEQRYAIDQYERIAKMFREKGLEDKEGPDREMLIDAMVDFWIESKRTMTFGYLGWGQYIVETKLRNGDATFVVGEQRWRYTVPEQDDNKTYMFLLDTTAKPNEQLYFFRKDLLLVD
jgi:hypothetical protein